MAKWINDGGHGGSDGGANHKGVHEKVFTLEASLYVNKRLKEHGITSAVTREKDITLSNGARTSIVRGYDKCISHHFNAGGGTGAEFIHSIYSDGKFEKYLADEFKRAGYDLRPLPIYTRRYPNNPKRDYYFMHRETGKCRTTIIEYDFLDGKNHDKLKNHAHRVGMYECVVRAVCRDENVRYKPLTKDKPESGTFYRVVTGSFKDRDNAEKRIKELKEKGFDSFIDIYKK